jgi:chromosome segregation ATPase
MGRMEELDKLDKAIKDAELRLKSIECNVEQIDKEIAVLEPRKNELEQNIEFHKKPDTIPIAHEFKKARAELSKIKARLILIVFDRKKALQACKDIEQILQKFKKDYAELIKTNDNNVLSPNFGGDRGKR